MLKLAIPMILAATAGISLVVQQALNANLRAALNSAVWSGFMSYFVGVICMVAIALVLQDPLPSAATAARIPWYAWSGGLFGAIFVALAIFLVPNSAPRRSSRCSLPARCWDRSSSTTSACWACPFTPSARSGSSVPLYWSAAWS